MNIAWDEHYHKYNIISEYQHTIIKLMALYLFETYTYSRMAELISLSFGSFLEAYARHRLLATHNATREMPSRHAARTPSSFKPTYSSFID